MLLKEVFGKTTEIETVEKTNNNFKLRFEVNDKVYYFVGDYWYINYPDENGKVVRVKSWHLSFHLETYDQDRREITGTGDAFQVFLHAQECLKLFYQHYPEAKAFSFSATDTELSRISLYDRMVKYIERTGWKLLKAFTSDGFKTYIFEKK